MDLIAILEITLTFGHQPPQVALQHIVILMLAVPLHLARVTHLKDTDLVSAV